MGEQDGMSQAEWCAYALSQIEGRPIPTGREWAHTLRESGMEEQYIPSPLWTDTVNAQHYAFYLAVSQVLYGFLQMGVPPPLLFLYAEKLPGLCITILKQFMDDRKAADSRRKPGDTQQPLRHPQARRLPLSAVWCPRA
jgi:hypothetical protein